ncbi:hypothetical protein D922_00867 [Enterococcus faecalis 06-MB-DW-09]|nr:hypothetical protein D922_00867 [Enterococcus faecalis 06-MB-DW-09]
MGAGGVATSLSQLSERGRENETRTKEKAFAVYILGGIQQKASNGDAPHEKGDAPVFFCPILSQKGLNLNDKRN